MNIKEIINIVDGELLSGSYEAEIGEIKQNSALIQNGDTFIAFKGENTDGHKYIEDAIKNGATVCIVEEQDIHSENATILYVENTEKALDKIIEFKIASMQMAVVAVTGSVGKTSTKDLIAEVLSGKYEVFKTPGNMNSNRGVPLTASAIPDDTAISVFELGMNNIGEIEQLSKIVKPDIAVITNIGSSHIGMLGGKENILKAKLEITSGLKEDGVLYLNYDDPILKETIDNINQDELPYYITTYGIEEGADIKALNINVKDDITYFDVLINGETESYSINTIGKHNVYNALVAISVAKSLNVETDIIKEGLLRMKATERRLDKFVTISNMIIFDDSYNASYESIKAAIDVIMNKNYYGRKVTILGDVFELGEFTEEFHKKIGEAVANKGINVLITAGESSIHINEEAKKINPNIIEYHFEKTEDIIENLDNLLKTDDIVLIKASNGMEFYKIADKLREEEVDPCDLK